VSSQTTLINSSRQIENLFICVPCSISQLTTVGVLFSLRSVDLFVREEITECCRFSIVYV
jgi:hypothetical protein